MPLKVIQKPNSGAIDLCALKFHLSLVVDKCDEYIEEDNILQEYIRAATEEYEEIYKTTLLTKELEWEFEGFKQTMEIPRPPLQSIEEVYYFDAAGDKQVIAKENYRTSITATPGFVKFVSSYSFPNVDPEEPFPVRIRYKAGYGDTPSAINSSVRVWLMNIVGTFYKQRDSLLVGFTGEVSVHDLRQAMSGLIAGRPKAMRFG